MITVLFMLVPICAILAAVVSPIVRSHYPGVCTLCHWVLLGSWGAGSVLGSAALFIGLRGSVGLVPMLLITSCIIVMTQLCGWLLFLVWLRDVKVQPPKDDELLNELSELRSLMARASEG